MMSGRKSKSRRSRRAQIAGQRRSTVDGSGGRGDMGAGAFLPRSDAPPPTVKGSGVGEKTGIDNLILARLERTRGSPPSRRRTSQAGRGYGGFRSMSRGCGPTRERSSRFTPATAAPTPRRATDGRTAPRSPPLWASQLGLGNGG